METRFLGRTGVRVSRLALGTMSFGGEADEAASAALFHRCREAGINLFDCADKYQQGRSEEVLGRLVRDCRDEIVLTTKAYFAMSDDGNDRGTSRYHLVRSLEASLRRLGTDYVDVFFLHRFDDVTDVEESFRALEDLVSQGKILYSAVSNFSAWQTMKALGIQRARGWAPLVCVQPMYSLLKRQAEVEILPLCVWESLGAITYSPMGGGLLSGKYGVDRRPDEGRLTSNVMYQTRYGDPANYVVADRLRELAAEAGCHPATLAIAWVASNPAVTAPIIGARDLEQLEPCLAAGTFTLDDELRAKVSALTPAPPPATDRNEEATEHNYGPR